MPDNTKDGVRKQERKVYVVVHNEETEITSLQTAASALPHQADISEKKMEILDKWADLSAHSYTTTTRAQHSNVFKLNIGK